MFVFDFPLSTKSRTYLKLESIFKRIQDCSAVQTEAESLCALRGFIDFIDLVDGYGAFKIDIGKDLDKLNQKLKNWAKNPEANQDLVKELLDQIALANKALDNFTRQRAVLKSDPLIEAIKPRFLTPAGVNCFDTPLYTFWSSLPAEEKQESIIKWSHELDCLRIPICCILNIWRLCADFQTRLAVKGFMQETAEPCEFFEIKYAKDLRCYPVVSAFQSNVNVRFWPFVKNAPVGDITFEMAYIRGGVL